MSEYVEKEKAVERVSDTIISRFGIGLTEAYEIAEDGLSLPPADVVPVRHGEWEYIDDTYCGFEDTDVRCSECKTTVSIKHFRKTKWCPDCGALMDGKK